MFNVNAIGTIVHCGFRKKAVLLQKFFKIGYMKTKEQLKRDTANVLKSLRKKSQEEDVRLTQEDLALGAGISVRYYNDIENGKKLPTLEVLMKIAYAYKITLAEICKQIEEY